MVQKAQLDQLERLVHLIADDNELLNRANNFMQNLVTTRFDYRGRTDMYIRFSRKRGSCFRSNL